MSSSGLPRVSAAVDAARQKLDELDALLQQMLTLPVNRLEPDAGINPAAPTDPATEKRPDVGLEPLADKVQAESPVEFAEPQQEPIDLSTPTAPATEHLLAQITGYRPELGDSAAGPKAAEQLSPPTTSEADLGEPGRTPWLLYPLVGLNMAFDGITYLLGPPGRWLRGSAGRSLLGLTGFGLLLAALGWAFLGWMGWMR